MFTSTYVLELLPNSDLNVNLFLHIFLCLKVILTMKHYIYSQFSSENLQYFRADNLPSKIWDNLPQSHFFYDVNWTFNLFFKY